MLSRASLTSFSIHHRHCHDRPPHAGHTRRLLTSRAALAVHRLYCILQQSREVVAHLETKTNYRHSRRFRKLFKTHLERFASQTDSHAVTTCSFVKGSDHSGLVLQDSSLNVSMHPDDLLKWALVLTSTATALQQNGTYLSGDSGGSSGA